MKKTITIDQLMKNNGKLSAILKTGAFFFVTFGIIVAVVVLLMKFGAEPIEKKDDAFTALDINNLAKYEYSEAKALHALADGRPMENQIPENVLALNGRKVSITGFIMPVRVDSGGYVREFALNGNYDMCFYGAPSRINQWVHVKMNEGTSAKFSHSPTRVYGTLEVGELIENGQVISLYRLSGEKVELVHRRMF